MDICNKREKFTCDWIFNILVVLCDGKVVCGCADPYGERPLGDLKDNNIYEIWNSERIKKIRNELNEGYSNFCGNCGLKRFLKDGEEIVQQPIHLEILPRIFFEPTILCNISCFNSVCNRDSGILDTRDRKQFPFNDFKSLIDDIGKNLIRLDFFNYGDPFVHPQSVEMIEYIKKEYSNIFLYTSTNGLMLDNKKIKRIVDSGLDEITFSVDGSDQKTYERYRQGGDLKKLLTIISKFVEERNRLGREVPFINWRYILFKWNDTKRKMNDARRLAEKIGVDRLSWEITDHPKDAISEKYQMGTKKWKNIYNEIWDSSQIGNAIKNKRHIATIKVTSKNMITKVKRPLEVDVQIKNIGGALWWKKTFSGKRIVRLGAQLFDANKNLIDLNYARAFIKRSMEKNCNDIINITLPPVTNPGRYWVKFDLVSEGIDWFESGGSPVVWRKFVVNP